MTCNTGEKEGRGKEGRKERGKEGRKVGRNKGKKGGRECQKQNKTKHHTHKTQKPPQQIEKPSKQTIWKKRSKRSKSKPLQNILHYRKTS